MISVLVSNLSALGFHQLFTACGLGCEVEQILSRLTVMQWKDLRDLLLHSRSWNLVHQSDLLAIRYCTVTLWMPTTRKARREWSGKVQGTNHRRF